MITLSYVSSEINININSNSRSVFLAGPSLRGEKRTPWRDNAISLFRDYGFNGIIYIPEVEDFKIEKSKQERFDWIFSCLSISDAILFWIPRDMIEYYGLSTNVEFGYCIGQYPDKVVYGRPRGAEKIGFLDKMYNRYNGGCIHDNLNETVLEAIKLCGN